MMNATTAGSIEIREICAGSYLLNIEEADIAWIFNPWPDIAKYIIQNDWHVNGVVYPDKLVQGGVSCNMIEFPLLHCMFVKKMYFRGEKPCLVGDERQISLAAESFKRGLHGFYSVDEMKDCDLTREQARMFMKEIKALSMKGIMNAEDCLELVRLNSFAESNGHPKPTVFRGASILKKDINIFEIEYGGKKAAIDCNLKPGQKYIPPLKIDVKNVEYKLFQIIDSGEEDGFSPKSCMHTLIQWRDKLICIDLPMNTQYLLEKLSISKNQIDAVIFTHNHDDHIGDLSLLLQVDKKVKIICPQVVWKSILLKASNMLAMSVKNLDSYFDHIPIKFGEEYDYCGLRILAHPSIHPVPCAIYRIRGMIDNKWKTYAHLSDILNLKRTKTLLDEEVISKRRYEEYKEFLLAPADVKKIDVGAPTGSEAFSVHGSWRDFRNDPSAHIIFGHIREEILEPEATAVVGQFAQVGSARDMGHKSFISYHDKIRERAILLIADYLFSLLEKSIERGEVSYDRYRDYVKIMADNEIELIQPNTPYLKQGKLSDYADLVITGLGTIWTFRKGKLNNVGKVQPGDVIGEMGVLNQRPRSAFVRSDTYMSVLRIPGPQFFEIATALGLYNSKTRDGALQKIWKNREALQRTAILSKGVPIYLQNKMAQNAHLTRYENGEQIYPVKKNNNQLILAPNNAKFDVYLNGKKWDSFFGPPVFNLSHFLGISPKGRYKIIARQRMTAMELWEKENQWIKESPLLRMRLHEALRLRSVRTGGMV